MKKITDFHAYNSHDWYFRSERGSLLVASEDSDGSAALEGMHRLFPGSTEMLLQVKIIIETALCSKGGRSDPAGIFLSLAKWKDRSAIVPCFCILLLSR